MSLDISSDCHVHTHLCRHAVGTMEEYVRAAIAKGFQRIVFQEHLEAGISYFERTWLRAEDFAFYFKEGKRLRALYSPAIEIGLGVEVGYNPDHTAQLLKLLSEHQWDQIGLSYHFCKIPGEKDHLNFLSKKKKNIQAFLSHDVSALLGHYFDTLIEAVAVIPANILCHLDAALRHIPGLELRVEHERQISRLLDQVKHRGMALEINTSGYETRDAPFPGFKIIRQAVARDIPLVAGSDAHSPEQVGRYFDRLRQDFEKL